MDLIKDWFEEFIDWLETENDWLLVIIVVVEFSSTYFISVLRPFYKGMSLMVLLPEENMISLLQEWTSFYKIYYSTNSIPLIERHDFPFTPYNRFINTNTIPPDLASTIINDPFSLPISTYTSPSTFIYLAVVNGYVFYFVKS